MSGTPRGWRLYYTPAIDCCFFTPKRQFSDNGGDFNNEEMRDMAEKFNIEVKITAAYSPWSNGLLERHNQILTEIPMKVKRDNKCDWKTALDWALMAKNSMHNVHGFSPYQLVFGQNPNLHQSLLKSHQLWKKSV